MSPILVATTLAPALLLRVASVVLSAVTRFGAIVAALVASGADPRAVDVVGGQGHVGRGRVGGRVGARSRHVDGAEVVARVEGGGHRGDRVAAADGEERERREACAERSHLSSARETS